MTSLLRVSVIPLLVVVTGLTFLPPAVADWSRPTSVTPRGSATEASDQATDRRGDTAYAYVADGSFNLRIRRADGDLSPVLALAPVVGSYSVLRVAVDRDGDGVVIWDQRSLEDFEATLYARRFTRAGGLGRVRQVSPASQYVSDAQVGVRPAGGAVITWNRVTDRGYRPMVRTLGVHGPPGKVRSVGRGPDAGAPAVVVESSGRTTLVWTNRGLLARRIGPDGALHPTRVVRRPAHRYEQLHADDLGVDRRGVITVACTRWTRNTAPPPQPDNSHQRACLLRISPRLRLLGKVQDLTGRRTTIDGVGLGVAPSGAAVVGWQRNYYEGAFVQRVTPEGTVGRRVKVADGGLGDIVLRGDGDGVVTSLGVASDGLHRIIRATRVVDGVLRGTRRVAANDYDTGYLRAGLRSDGRAMISWNEELGTPRIMVSVGR